MPGGKRWGGKGGKRERDRACMIMGYNSVLHVVCHNSQGPTQQSRSGNKRKQKIFILNYKLSSVMTERYHLRSGRNAFKQAVPCNVTAADIPKYEISHRLRGPSVSTRSEIYSAIHIFYHRLEHTQAIFNETVLKNQVISNFSRPARRVGSGRRRGDDIFNN